MPPNEPLISNLSQAPEYRLKGLRAFFLVVLLCLTYMFDYADRMVVGSLIPFIKADWRLTDHELGSLTSVIYLTIALFVLPLSLIVDRWSRRKMISIMVFFWSMAILACAFTRNYRELLWARAMVGLGEAGYAPAGTAVLAGAFPTQIRAKVMGFWNAFIPLGAATGFIAGGYIGQNWGWRNAFGLVALPGIILAVLFWFTRDYRTVPLEDGTPERGRGSVTSLGRSIKGLLKVHTLWFVYLAFAMNTAITTCLMTWLPSYFHRFHGMSEEKAGTMAAGLALLVLVGAPLGGFLADRWRKKRLDARMVFSGLTSGTSAILLALAFLFSHSPAFGPLLVTFGVLTVCYVAPSAAVTQDVVHPGLRALSYGLCVICQHLFGGAWSPMFIGALSDKVGLDRALFVIPIFGMVASALLLVGSRNYVRDLEKVKAVTLVQE